MKKRLRRKRQKKFYGEGNEKVEERYQREKEEICARYVAEGKAGYGA